MLGKTPRPTLMFTSHLLYYYSIAEAEALSPIPFHIQPTTGQTTNQQKAKQDG